MLSILVLDRSPLLILFLFLDFGLRVRLALHRYHLRHFRNRFGVLTLHLSELVVPWILALVLIEYYLVLGLST